MTQTISPRVEFLTRAEWDTSGLPRLGYAVARSVRTECIVHHTVSSDNDLTPTIWETLDEIKKHMRVLQQVRPDLGLDVPYNFVAFCRPGNTLTICEGRGFDRDGAHTKYHNKTGLATSFAANFEANPVPAIIPALNEWFGYQKGVCPTLATFHGHRDFTGGNTGVGWTACPGKHLYALKPQWTWAKLEDDMKDLIQITGQSTWTLGPLGKRRLRTDTEVSVYLRAGWTVTEVTQAEANEVADAPLSHYKT